MRNFLAVLVTAAVAVAALTLVGEDDASASTAAEAQVAEVTEPGLRWEYRVLSTRVNPVARQAHAEGAVRFVGLRSAASTSASNGADRLANLERELNRLGGEGWEMCSAATDGTMVFRRAK